MAVDRLLMSGVGAAQAQAPAQDPASGGVANAPVSDPVSGGISAPQHYDGYAWLVAWGVMLAILTLANRTRVGHAAIYYGLLLLLFFVIVSNYRFITTALAPFQSLP